MAAKLSFEVFGPRTTKSVAFLHGILGHKRNWRTPALAWRKLHPDFSCVTIDHRGHGLSQNMQAPHTIQACVDDLKELFDQELLPTPDIVMAHSFGGKVALNYLQSLHRDGKDLPTHTWILDSIPRKYNKALDLSDASNSVVKVFHMLSQLPATFPSREWFVEELSKEVPRSIALWLATNIVMDEHNKKIYRFGVELDVVSALFEDFCRTDFTPFLGQYYGEGHIHFVRAGKNSLWDKEGAIEELHELASRNDRIHVHTMEHVGHWLHAEDLNGLFNLVRRESSLLDE